MKILDIFIQVLTIKQFSTFNSKAKSSRSDFKKKIFVIERKGLILSIQVYFGISGRVWIINQTVAANGFKTRRLHIKINLSKWDNQKLNILKGNPELEINLQTAKRKFHFFIRPICVLKTLPIPYKVFRFSRRILHSWKITEETKYNTV